MNTAHQYDSFASDAFGARGCVMSGGVIGCDLDQAKGNDLAGWLIIGSAETTSEHRAVQGPFPRNPQRCQ